MSTNSTHVNPGQTRTTYRKQTMPLTHIPNLQSKRVLWFSLSALRILAVIGALTYSVVALLEFKSNKEILHLTMFSMFILFTNFQIKIGTYSSVVIKENSAKIFMISMFTLTAALLELVDLAFDQILKKLNAPGLEGYYLAVNVIDSILGIFAVLVFCYSLIKFISFLRSQTVELKEIQH